METKPLTPHQVDKDLAGARFTKSVTSTGSGYRVNYGDRGTIRVTYRTWSMAATNEQIFARLDNYAAALAALGYQATRDGLTVTVTRKDTDAAMPKPPPSPAYTDASITRALHAAVAAGQIRGWEKLATRDPWSARVRLADGDQSFPLDSLREAHVFVAGLASSRHAELRRAAGPVLDSEITAAIRRVVEYNWRDEKRDYAECAGNGNSQAGHIFGDLRLIREAVGQ
jgi:hypothetical protein